MKPETVEKLSTLLAQAGRGVATFAGDVWAVVSEEIQMNRSESEPVGEGDNFVSLPSETHTDPDQLLEIEEAAALLKVEVGTLYAWAAQGKIPSRKVGSLVRFHRGELMAWTVPPQKRAERSKPRRTSLRMVNSGRS